MKGNDKWRECESVSVHESEWVSAGAKGRDLQEQIHQMNSVKKSPRTHVCSGHDLKQDSIF